MATIKFRRGVFASIPTLAAGEPGWATDTQYLYVGTGSGNIKFAKVSDLHAQNHETRHRSGGADVLNHDHLAGFLAAEHKSLPNTIAQVLSDHSKAVHDALGLDHANLSNVLANQHHPQSHAHGSHSGIGVNDHHKQVHTHDSHSSIGANDHHPQSHTLASHSTKPHSALTGVSADQHHPKFHASQHHVGGGDLVNHDSLTGFVAAEHKSLPSFTAQVLTDHNKALHDALLITALGSGALAKDHGTPATDMLSNICYGAGSPPTANTTTIGTIWLKYV